MPVGNTPSHSPKHGDLLSLKGHVSPSDALNAVESEAQRFEGRSSTAAERARALDIGAKLNAGTLDIGKPPAVHSGTTAEQPRAPNTKTFFTP